VFAVFATGFCVMSAHTASALGGTGFELENNNRPASPIDTTNLGDLGVTQVEVGGGLSSFVLAEDGRVFSWGENSNGQLGLSGVTDQFVNVPTPIDTTNLVGRKITQVSADGRCLILADDGSLFSFGAGTTIATQIDTTSLGGRRITQVSAGGSSFFGGLSLLLADDGSVFSFGEGTPIVPIDTTNLGGRKIAQVSAGWNHNLLLADDGSVFAFGSNASGKTGLGTNSGDTLVATPIDTSNLRGLKIAQVAAGKSHSLLLAEDGSVFSFGSNAYGATGLGTITGETLVATPIDAANLGEWKIMEVAAGTDRSLVLAEDGFAFAFGSGGFGSVPNPIDRTNLTGMRVTGISTGIYESLLVAEPRLEGDYNDNGVVDAADYVVWRDTLEQLVLPGRGADGFANGEITALDYRYWKARFGNTLGAGDAAGLANLAVPEPSAVALLLLILAEVVYQRSRR
jgi:alpha-tubulin suppressor-like RCC1 family protein